jgi:hypothetical protein
VVLYFVVVLVVVNVDTAVSDVSVVVFAERETVSMCTWMSPSKKKGSGGEAAPVRGTKLLPGLHCCSGGSGLFEERYRFAYLCNAKKHDRRVRARLEPAVSVVDVNVSFAEPRGRPC